MREIVRHTGAIFIAILYSIGLVFTSVNASSLNSANIDKSDVEKMDSHAVSILDLVGFTYEYETSTNNYNDGPSSQTNNLINTFSGLVKSSERNFLIEFTQYLRNSRNIRIRFRKMNLIFPFQYFW